MRLNEEANERNSNKILNIITHPEIDIYHEYFNRIKLKIFRIVQLALIPHEQQS